jgi:hypothetical protein
MRHLFGGSLKRKGGLIPKKYSDERIRNSQSAVVVDESKFLESIHKKVDPSARRTDHLCQNLLADFGDDLSSPFCLSKVCEQQERSGKTLLNGIKELVDQVRFDSEIALQQEFHEYIRKFRIDVQRREQTALGYSADNAVREGDRARNVEAMPGNNRLAQKISGSQNADDNFFAAP